jgi:prepilin-type N-terminal cleavage/methylation domain-containing protein
MSTNRRQTGMSLAEVMISLAISAMLLTAIGAAFNSSSAVIQQNERFFRATQSGRVGLNQMLTEVRRSDAIVDHDTTITTATTTFVVQGISANRLSIYRPAEARVPGEMVRYYRYDPTAKRLLLSFVSDQGVVSTEYPLAEDVQSSPFTWDMGTDANNATCVARVAVSLDVQVGTNHVRLSGSAAPRRSLSYQ